MIVTRTPLRVSFFGGGTDFPQFFGQESGSVLSSAIDKYIYVVAKQRFDDRIRVSYTRTELVGEVEEIQHELVRECLKLLGIEHGIEIATMGDIPSAGSGLGSSSTVTVGLLHALHVFCGHRPDPLTLAREACRVEIDVLGKPIGVQDQYAAAFGGQLSLCFHGRDHVEVGVWPTDDDGIRTLDHRLLLFFTNVTRRSEQLLCDQVAEFERNLPVLREMKDLTSAGRELLVQGDFDAFGRLLHRGWELKKRLNHRISSREIDEIYETGLKSGALGGKITGAGGGGFILFYCPLERQARLRQSLEVLRELPFRLEPGGSAVLLGC